MTKEDVLLVIIWVLGHLWLSSGLSPPRYWMVNLVASNPREHRLNIALCAPAPLNSLQGDGQEDFFFYTLGLPPLHILRVWGLYPLTEIFFLQCGHVGCLEGGVLGKRGAIP